MRIAKGKKANLKKGMYCVSPIIRNCKTTKTIKGSVVARGSKGRREE